MPCRLGSSCECSTAQKSMCKNWEPGRGSKYYRCGRFISTRATCQLPNGSCASCEWFIKELPKAESTINWDDPDAVRAHRAAYMRDYRAGKRRRQ
jgi:hypothetical protein